jgi:hypothetical protein
MSRQVNLKAALVPLALSQPEGFATTRWLRVTSEKACISTRRSSIRGRIVSSHGNVKVKLQNYSTFSTQELHMNM